MEPGDEEQAALWQKNRWQAYQGSLRHFLRTLATNRLDEEGYLVYNVPQPSKYLLSLMTGDALPGEAKRVHEPDLMTKRALSFERMLSFEHYLEVIYTQEPEAREYLLFRDARDDEPDEKQFSWLGIAKDTVVFDVLGRLEDGYQAQIFGYWFWERVAELLPMEYGSN